MTTVEITMHRCSCTAHLCVPNVLMIKKCTFCLAIHCASSANWHFVLLSHLLWLAKRKSFGSPCTFSVTLIHISDSWICFSQQPWPCGMPVVMSVSFCSLTLFSMSCFSRCLLTVDGVVSCTESWGTCPTQKKDLLFSWLDPDSEF